MPKNYLNIGLLLWDEEERIIHINNDFYTLFGYKKEELSSLRDWFMLAFPDEIIRDQAKRAWQSAKSQNEEPLEFYSITCKDGSIREIQLSISLAGPITIAKLMNVTDTEKIEESLQEKSSILDKLLQESPHFISIMNKEGYALLISDTTSPLTKMKKEELIGKNIAEILPHPAKKEFLEQAKRMQIEKKPFSISSAAQGEEREMPILLWFYPLTREDMTIKGILGICATRIDTTIIEEDLKRNEALLRASQRMTGVGGWEWDIEKQTMFWTDEAYLIHDFELGEFLPGTPEHIAKSMECYRPEDRPIIHKAFERCVEKGEPYDLEFPFTTAKGRKLWIRTIAEPIIEEGRITRVLGNIMDITKHRKTLELIEARVALLRFASKNSLDAVLQKTLDIVCSFMESPIGFYHFVSPDEKTLTLKAWSTDTLEYFCKMGDTRGMQYRIADAGVWTECIQKRRPIIHNDYASLPHKKGMPEGHALVTREVVVPIMREERIVSILGVGNKSEDYSEEDIQIVSFFADVAWEIAEDKMAEEKIQEYTTTLELQNLELESLYDHLDREIEKAMTIHQRTLPKRLPESDNLKIAAYYQPADIMGGDFYHSIKKGSKIISYVSDVTGHGLESALLSSFVKDMVNSYIAFTPVWDIKAQDIIKFLYEQYRENNFPEDYFVCIYVTALDLETLELTYIGSGAQNDSLLSLGDKEQLHLNNSGLPISSTFPFSMLNTVEKKIALQAPFTLLLNTDGITEQSIGEERYEDRLNKIFFKNAHLPPESIVEVIREDFKHFNRGSLLGDDDITFLVIQVR